MSLLVVRVGIKGSNMTTQSDDHHHDLSPAKVQEILDQYDIRTLGRPYLFLPSASRTMEGHLIPRPPYSLVLANRLTGAKSGIGTWQGGGPSGNNLTGSIAISDMTAAKALHCTTQAMRHAITKCAAIKTSEFPQRDCPPVAQIFVQSGKVAGLLAEVDENGTVIVGFDVRINEPNNHTLRLGQTSLMLQTGRKIKRDEVLGEFLAKLESMILPKHTKMTTFLRWPAKWSAAPLASRRRRLADA
jgi:hypothetical protein